MIYAYDEDGPWLDDSSIYYYYEDSIVNLDAEYNRVWEVTKEEGDSTFSVLYLFGGGTINYTYYKDELIKSVTKTEDEYVVREYIEEPIKGKVVRSYTLENGKMTNEYFMTYKNGIVVKVVYMNHEKNRKVLTEYEYFKE